MLKVPLDTHDIMETSHGPGGKLTIPVPDESPTLDLSLELGENFVCILLPYIRLRTITAKNTKIITQ